MRKLFALLVLLALFSATNAVFFFLEEGKQFCFYEDINEDTPVIVSYTIPSLDDSLRQKMHEIVPTLVHSHPFQIEAVITEPSGNQIQSEIIKNKEGVLLFRSGMGQSGMFQVCFKTTSSHWFGVGQKSEFHIKIAIDLSAKENTKVESKERISKLGDLLSNLQNEVHYVSSDQVYFKEREERFRDTSESTYTRIWWIGFFQFLVCVSVSIWQLQSLQRYLKAKKFV